MTVTEAVNIILETCGLGRVATLETGERSEAGYAENTLSEVSLRVQKKGWYFNTRRDVELSPNADDKIALPDGVISIDADKGSAYRNITHVGGFLYDLDNNRDTFDGSVRVRYVQLWEFSCVPHPIADYIAGEAAWEFSRRHGRRFIGTHELGFVIAAARDLRGRTWLDAKRYDTSSGNNNLLETDETRRVKGDRDGVGINIADIRGTE